MKVTVRFLAAQLTRQDLGTSDGDVLEAELTYALVLPDRVVDDLHSKLKLTAGAQYVEGMLELSIPEGYDGPWNHLAFTDCARRYFLERVVHVTPGARPKDITIGKAYMGIRWDCSFETEE